MTDETQSQLPPENKPDETPPASKETEHPQTDLQLASEETWGSALRWIFGAIMWCAVFVLIYVMQKGEPAENINLPDRQESADIMEPGLEKIPAYVKEFSFTDRTGKTITNEDLKGKPFVCDFIFTRCLDTCPIITKKMRELADELEGKGIQFVSFTVDPKHDTVEVLDQYAQTRDADRDYWYFLTGNRSELYELIRSSFLVAVVENFNSVQGYEFAHSERFFHVDETGKILGSYYAIDNEQFLALKKVLKEDLPTPKRYQFFHTKKIHDEPKKAETLPDGKVEKSGIAPPWVKKMPLVNTTLNGFAGFLLIIGVLAIKMKMPEVHKKIMLAAFGVSVAFLICYLSYHFGLHYYTGESSKKYEGAGLIRYVYYSILITHVILAAFVPVLAIITIHKGIRKNWRSHHKWAKVTFPVWLYVSITGVIIYLMLYRII